MTVRVPFVGTSASDLAVRMSLNHAVLSPAFAWPATIGFLVFDAAVVAAFVGAAVGGLRAAAATLPAEGWAAHAETCRTMTKKAPAKGPRIEQRPWYLLIVYGATASSGGDRSTDEPYACGPGLTTFSSAWSDGCGLACYGWRTRIRPGGFDVRSRTG